MPVVPGAGCRIESPPRSAGASLSSTGAPITSTFNEKTSATSECQSDTEVHSGPRQILITAPDTYAAGEKIARHIRIQDRRGYQDYGGYVRGTHGRRTRRLDEGPRRPGTHAITFGGRDVPVGMYLYEVHPRESRLVRPMMILR